MTELRTLRIGIIPESNRKGRAVCQFWLQGGKHNVTPIDKNPSDESHPGDLSREGLQRTRQTQCCSRLTHLAKLNPNCHMNYLEYL